MPSTREVAVSGGTGTRKPPGLLMAGCSRPRETLISHPPRPGSRGRVTSPSGWAEALRAGHVTSRGRS